MVGLGTWWPQDSIFLWNSPTVILGDFFGSLIILFAVHGGKINMGPLLGKFVTLKTLTLQLFNYCPNNIHGHFQVSSYFFYSHSLTYEAQHTFPSFDLCVLLSFPCWCMNKGIWPLCHLIFIPQWNKKSRITTWKFLNTLINFKK